MITWPVFEVPLIDLPRFGRFDAAVLVCNVFEPELLAVNREYCQALFAEAVTVVKSILCTCRGKQ